MEGLLGDVAHIGPPIRWLDHLLAVILIFLTVFGVIGNVLSLIFFTTEHVRNRNSLYFKRVYQTINLVDLLICGSLFPVIDAFIEDPGFPKFYSNQPHFFKNQLFCTGWGMLWEVLPSFSVYLVGVLSISRLILLTWRHAKMISSLVCVFMAAYFIFTVVIKLALLLTYDSMDYEPMMRYCLLVSHDDEQFAQHEITTLGILIGQLTLPIIPVSICFVITMMLLLQERHKKMTSRRHNAQHHAAITVTMVTFLYIICNIPVLINFSYYIHALIISEGRIEFAKIYSNSFLFYYTWPLVYILSVAINAAVNPCVYYWRMKRYRTFIVGVVTVAEEGQTGRKINELRVQLSSGLTLRNSENVSNIRASPRRMDLTETCL
jgi:hypothetical protein